MRRVIHRVLNFMGFVILVHLVAAGALALFGDRELAARAVAPDTWFFLFLVPLLVGLAFEAIRWAWGRRRRS